MIRLFSAIVLTLGLSLFGLTQSHSQWNGCQAGFCNKSSGIVAYQGPGDVKASALVFYSCARAYTASYASGGGSLCDVVDTATGLTTCTFHAQTNGFVNPSECNATACATACSVTKAYNQVSPGTDDVTNATLAQMPLVQFSALNGLPGIKCASTGTICVLASSNVTQTQPIVLSSVMERSGAFTTAQDFFGCSSSQAHTGFTVSANTAFVHGSSDLTATATDGSFHSINGLANNTSSAINVDGTDTTGSAGTTGCSAASIRVHRTTNQSQGTIMEGGIWTTAWTSTDRNNMSTNQHGANGYNF